MQHPQDAAAAGRTTPAIERGHVAPHDAAPETFNNRRNDSPADRPAGQDRKEFATLQAQLALRGHALHELRGGGYVVTRWNLNRELPDLATVRAFAERVGAA